MEVGDALRALGGLAKRPGADVALPGTVVHRGGVEQEQSRLVDYVRLCGGSLRDAVPAGWLHVLAFPAQLELMTSREFPFGVLGMVHVQNSMSLRRPVLLTDLLDISCRAENLRPHRRGAVVDLVSEISVDGQSRWTGRSSYLAQGARVSGEPEATPSAVDVARLKPTGRWPLPRDLGRRYAAVSGDGNPIHLYPFAARAFGFPTTIAHGMWAQGRVLGALDAELPKTYDVDIAFAKPMLLGHAVEFRTCRREDGWDYAVTSAERIHLTGRVRAGSADDRR